MSRRYVSFCCRWQHTHHMVNTRVADMASSTINPNTIIPMISALCELCSCESGISEVVVMWVDIDDEVGISNKVGISDEISVNIVAVIFPPEKREVNSTEMDDGCVAGNEITVEVIKM